MQRKARPVVRPPVVARPVGEPRVQGSPVRPRAGRSAPARVRPVKQRVRPVKQRARRGMGAVLAFARAQVGKPYVPGADGPHAFDCSGFTKAAYARAGIRLPHQSGAQAARAFRVSWSQARPGDLVVGPGHVGIYAGGGMMYDAGNSRVDVTYRRVYDGLWIERLR